MGRNFFIVLLYDASLLGYQLLLIAALLLCQHHVMLDQLLLAPIAAPAVLTARPMAAPAAMGLAACVVFDA